MLGKRTVRSPRAMMAFARTTGRAERSSTVNMRRMFSSHTAGLLKEMTSKVIQIREKGPIKGREASTCASFRSIHLQFLRYTS